MPTRRIQQVFDIIVDIDCHILLFYRRLLCSDNIVLRTLAGLVRFEILGIAAKYDNESIYFSTATAKNAVLSSFVNVVKF